MRLAGARLAPCAIALVLAGTAAGCADPYYYGNGYRYGYGPNYAYASGGYYPPTYSDRYYYNSKWDYYRNYQGSFHPGPERYP